MNSVKKIVTAVLTLTALVSFIICEMFVLLNLKSFLQSDVVVAVTTLGAKIHNYPHFCLAKFSTAGYIYVW